MPDASQLDLIHEYGPTIGMFLVLGLSQIGMIWFLLRWQRQQMDQMRNENQERETRMGKRLDEQQDTINTTMTTALKEATAIIGACQVTLARGNDLQREYNEIRRQELELQKTTRGRG